MLFKRFIHESVTDTLTEPQVDEDVVCDVADKCEEKNESYDEEGNLERCEACGMLLNDTGTCPKCDHGEPDPIEEKMEVKEELSNIEKLKAAYPELNFDRSDSDVISEAACVEELSVREKLKAAYPELDFDKDTDEFVESVDEDSYDEYDDDYYALDDVEQDRAHAALYGGDRMYCDCGRKLVMDEWGGHCPHCDPQEFED